MGDKRKLSLRKTSFLKILQNDFINKLPIPSAFTNNFEGKIPQWFILEIAGSRKCWRVDIEQDEYGMIYLGYGFDCFVKEHSLQVGNFLLFEHKNPSILEVKIYEKDGSERTAETNIMSEYEVGAAYESPTEIPIIHQEGNASPCPSMATSNTLTPVQFRANEKQHGLIGNGGGERKKYCVSAAEHDLCFSLTWKLTHHFLYHLTIPRGLLSGKSFSNGERITVKDGEGNSWQMELRQRADGRVDLARGWKEFVDDNKLANGDTLTFKFVSEYVIEVHVQRASHINDPSQRDQEGINQLSEPLNMTCEDEELAEVRTPSDKMPLSTGELRGLAPKLKSSFTLNWTHKTRNSHLHIPMAIVKKQKLENNDIVILCDPKGKHWSMEVKTRPSDGRVGIGRRWRDFTEANDLEFGDTLIFEFVTDRMIKVDVVKARVLDYPDSEATIKQEVFNLY